MGGSGIDCLRCVVLEEGYIWYDVGGAGVGGTLLLGGPTSSPRR